MCDVYKGAVTIPLGDCPNMHLHYILKQCESGNEVVFWLQIKLETLASWKRDILSSHLKAGLYYIELVNVSIPGDAFCLNHRSVGPETQLSQICIDAETRKKIPNEKGHFKQRQTFWKSGQRMQFGEVTSKQWRTGNWKQAAQCKNQKQEKHILRNGKKYADIEKEREHFLETLKEKELNNACQEDCDNMNKCMRQLEKDQFSQVRGTAIPKQKST